MNEHFDRIADGLSEDGFAVIDNFLSLKEVQAILELDVFTEGINNFRKAGVGKEHHHQVNEAIRGDYIRWIDKITSPQPAKVYLDRLDELISFLNQSLFLSLKGL